MICSHLLLLRRARFGSGDGGRHRRSVDDACAPDVDENAATTREASMDRPERHTACVDHWLASLPADLDSPRHVDFFQKAVDCVHSQVCKTLGEITVRAVTDRVVHLCADDFPDLSALRVMPDGSVRCEELRRQGSALLPEELIDGTRAVLIDLLSVLGSLTAEVLTPELHRALLRSIEPPSSGLLASTPRSPMARRSSSGLKES
jgi:hypothetical protein